MGIKVGDMRERLSIHKTQTDETGNVQWIDAFKAWANVETTGKKIPYASTAASGDEICITMWKNLLTTSHLVLWGGRPYKPVSIAPYSQPGFIVVKAAKVLFVTCEKENQEGEKFSFPGFLAEKWVKHQEKNPFDSNVMQYVLVTPKEVELESGAIITSGSESYHLLLGHTLEEDYNEYEIRRTEDS